MFNREKVTLKHKNVKNLHSLNNQSNSKRNNFQVMKKDTNPYNHIYNNSPNKVYNNANITDEKNIQSPSYRSYYNNSNNNYLPVFQQNFNGAKNPISFQNKTKNREKECLINIVTDLINKNENKKGKQIIKDYYSKRYIDMIKKNIDAYPDGINLSISNCETQYPINNLNDEHDFFKKLKNFLDDYEKSNKNYNNFGNVKTSYEFYSKTPIKKENKNKAYRYLSDKVGQILNTSRQDIINNHNHKDNYTNEYLNKSIGKFYNEFNKNCNNFCNINKSNDRKYKNTKNNNEISSKEKNVISNTQEKINKNIFKNWTKSRIKLMNIESKKREEKNIYKNVKNIALNENKKDLLIGKNLIKEYELQERYISKIKLFIGYIESFFILSLNKSFHYFIRNLQFYGMKQLSKNKDCKKLLKRFQKTRNNNLNYNTISFNKSMANTINHTYDLNGNNLIDKNKNKLFIKNKKEQKIDVSPNVYITKNKINKLLVSNNKNRINVDISTNISNQIDIENTDDKTNKSTDYNSQKIFNSNEMLNLLQKNLIKNNIINNKEMLIKNKVKDKNNFNNISLFYANSKNDDSFNKIYFKKKPTVYLRPKNDMKNQKKMIVSKDIYHDPTNNYIKNNSKIIKSLLFEKGIYISPIKSKFPKEKENQKYIYRTKKTEPNNLRAKIPIKDVINELVVKDIVSDDKRLWITIKYVSSENLNQKFLKVKIRRRLLNIKDNKNMLLNKELDLQPTNIGNIEVIHPITTLKSVVQKSGNEISGIPEEKDINISKKILEIINIIQKAQKRNILYFYNYFIDTLSQKPISDKIKIENNFTNLKEIDFSKISNNIIEDNANEIDEDNNIENGEENNNKIKNIKIKYWKRNLFPEIKIPKINTEDNIYKNNETLNKFNKSDIFERSDFSYNTIGEKSLNFSEIYHTPQKNSFRLKITRYKIFKEKIGESKQIKTKKDIIKVDEEMRKRNKMTFLLTNKFSYYTNNLRLIRNYFNIWKNRDNINVLNNYNKINEEFQINNNNLQTKENGENIAKKTNEKKAKEEFEIKEEENESKIDNLDGSKDEEIIKINDLIKNNSDAFNLCLNSLNRTNNQKGILIDSIQDSEENNSIHFDKGELEEKVEYFRMYLISHYVSKRKNSGSSEEEKVE